MAEMHFDGLLEGFQQFKNKKPSIQAYQHTGPSKQVHGKDGMKFCHTSDYVVLAGFTEKTETVPPKTDKNGTRSPGFQKVTQEPYFEVYSAEDFELLYEPYSEGDE